MNAVASFKEPVFVSHFSSYISYFWVWRHSSKVDWALPLEITAFGVTALQARLSCTLVLSTICTDEDSRSWERFKVFLERHCPSLYLVSSWITPLTKWCGQNEASDQFTIRTPRSVSKPAEPSLDPGNSRFDVKGLPMDTTCRILALGWNGCLNLLIPMHP